MKKIIDTIEQINHTVLTGAMDIAVMCNAKNNLKSTPFYLSVSASKILQPKEKQVEIYINGQLKSLRMRLNSKGQGYFPSGQKQLSDSQSQKSHSEDEDFFEQKEFPLDWASTCNRTIQNKLNKKKDKPIQQAKEASFKNLNFLFGFFKSTNKPNPKHEKELQSKYSKDEQAIHQQCYQGQLNYDPKIHLSLCRHLIDPNMTNQEIVLKFYSNLVTEKAFAQDPISIINNANLMVLIDRSLYTWQIGLAALISQYAFGRVPREMIERLSQSKKGFLWYKKSGFKIDLDQEIIQNQVPIERKQSREIPAKKQSKKKGKYNKRPTSQQLKSLDLKPGKNNIQFIVDNHKINAHIFLYEESQSFVISDIDGTITQEDVLGQLYPMVGKSFIHPGVIELYNSLSQRSYNLIYLTARSVGQAQQTKEFLQNAKSLDGLHLPAGPMFTSSEGIFNAFRKQVIDKTPEVIKIDILNQIQRLNKSRKFIKGGFGNRGSDLMAYKAIGLEEQQIFIVNVESNVKRMSEPQVNTSYQAILKDIDCFFPSIQ